MAQEDLKNNQGIRKVLVRHWIDLGRISIHSAGGRATIRGSMMLLRGVKHELDSQAMENIMREIKHIREIRLLNVELDNWVQVDGAWHRTEDAGLKRSKLEGDNQNSYEM